MFKEKLREYIKIKGFSQIELSEMLGDSQQAISDFLKKDSNPQKKTREKYLEKLVGFEEFYKQISIKKQDIVSEPFQDSYIENKNGNKFTPLPNGKYIAEVPKVPYTAYASFIEVYGDEYQTNNEFETSFFTVDHVGRGKYIAFTTGNDSMNGGDLYDTPSGAEVLGREVQRSLWRDGFRETEYGFIVVAQNGIFHKDLGPIDDDGNVLCRSRNKSPEFPDFTINLNEVHSIFNIIKRTF